MNTYFSYSEMKWIHSLFIYSFIHSANVYSIGHVHVTVKKDLKTYPVHALEGIPGQWEGLTHAQAVRVQCDQCLSPSVTQKWPLTSLRKGLNRKYLMELICHLKDEYALTGGKRSSGWKDIIDGGMRGISECNIFWELQQHQQHQQ